MLNRCLVYKPQGFVREQRTNAFAFLPTARLATVGLPIICRNHSALRTVHENANSTAVTTELVIKRTDEVRTANALVCADDFRMHRVIDQGSDSFPRTVHGLNDMTTMIIQPVGIIVVGDFSFRFAGSNF